MSNVKLKGGSSKSVEIPANLKLVYEWGAARLVIEPENERVRLETEGIPPIFYTLEVVMEALLAERARREALRVTQH